MVHQFFNAISGKELGFARFNVFSHFVIAFDGFGGELNGFGFDFDFKFFFGQLFDEKANGFLKRREAHLSGHHGCLIAGIFVEGDLQNGFVHG